MKKGKKRFEIACYKNKVLEWRSGVEKDLDNVLQIPQVFLSVSKGQTAPKEDLEKGWGKGKSVEDIVLEILNKGELQVGEKERNAMGERVHNEVLNIVSGKLVDPKTKRVYPPSMIEKFLDQLSAQGSHREEKDTPNASGTATPTGERREQLPSWTGVVTTRSAKSQALDAMKALIAHYPDQVMRARMRLRITCNTGVLKQATKSAMPATQEGEDGVEEKKGTVKDRILGYCEQVESQDVLGDEWESIAFVEPGAFKLLSEFVGSETKGRGRVEVLDMAVMHEDT